MLITYLILCMVFLVAVKVYYQRTRVIYKGNERLEGKTIVITGANSGVGLLAAKEFARRGARVVMVCRDMLKGDRAKSEIIAATYNSNISLKYLDFLNLESVRKCANEILTEEERIDILVNNAATLEMTFGSTSDGLEYLMQNNYYGPFLFTNLLLGKIKQSAPSRIVNVTSMAHPLGRIDFDQMKHSKRWIQFNLYCDMKLAFMLFSRQLARKLNGTGVTSNSLEPGVFKSDVVRNSNWFAKLCFKITTLLFDQSREFGTTTLIYVSLSPDISGVTGKYFMNCTLTKPAKEVENVELAEKLWKFSEEAVNLKSNEKHY